MDRSWRDVTATAPAVGRRCEAGVHFHLAASFRLRPHNLSLLVYRETTSHIHVHLCMENQPLTSWVVCCRGEAIPSESQVCSRRSCLEVQTPTHTPRGRCLRRRLRRPRHCCAAFWKSCRAPASVFVVRRPLFFRRRPSYSTNPRLLHTISLRIAPVIKHLGRTRCTTEQCGFFVRLWLGAWLRAPVCFP